MRVIVAPAQSPHASAADPGKSAAAAPGVHDAAARLGELFRLWLRERHVHPLIHLMQRYRSESRE
jgi:hypothetical protein